MAAVLAVRVEESLFYHCINTIMLNGPWLQASCFSFRFGDEQIKNSSFLFAVTIAISCQFLIKT